MKDVLKYLPHPVMVAVLAGIMQFTDGTAVKMAGEGLPLFAGWIGFAAWACYFVNGCTPKGGLKVIGCWTGGVIAAILIVKLGTALTAANVPQAFPIAVTVVAFFVICFEKVPVLDFIPGWFVGAACCFACINGASGYGGNIYGASKIVLISCVIAQLFGYVTVSLRTAYAKVSELVVADEAS